MINLEKQIALLHVRAFRKSHIEQLSADLGFHLDGGIWLHISDGPNLDRNGFLCRGPDADRYGRKRHSAGLSLRSGIAGGQDESNNSSCNNSGHGHAGISVTETRTGWLTGHGYINGQEKQKVTMESRPTSVLGSGTTDRGRRPRPGRRLRHDAIARDSLVWRLADRSGNFPGNGGRARRSRARRRLRARPTGDARAPRDLLARGVN